MRLIDRRLEFAAAEVATAAAAAATAASCNHSAADEQRLQEKTEVTQRVERCEIPRFLTFTAGDVTTKYALTFSSPNCSAMYKPSEP